MATGETTSTTPAEEPKAVVTPVETVVAKLKTLNVEEAVITKITQDLGAESETDLALLSEADLVGAGMKPIPAKRLLASLKEAAIAPAAAAMASMGSMNFDALPPVPTEESWLSALRAGGVLKVDQSSVISVIRVALAQRVNLYEIPKLLVGLMEEYADTNDEQVDPLFFKLRKELTRSSYAEVFEAIDGLDGSYVTEARKKKLMLRGDQYLWPAITSFNALLQGWYDAYTKGAMNPMLMMSNMAAMIGGGGGAALPPGMLQQVPDTGGLRDGADAFADSVNKVFAGTGVQIAAALAYEAKRVRDTLSDVRLPALIGVANREQMLKKLGVAVPATYERLEKNLTQFVLATMQVKDQPSGNHEIVYFYSLAMLGSQIPWDQLGVVVPGRANGRRRPSGIGEELS